MIVENDLIQASLSQSLKDLGNVKVMYSKQVKDFAEETEVVDLKMNDDSKISTKLLIGK